MPRSHTERVLAGRAGSLESWARTPDRAARTANARKAANDKFMDAVPAEITDPIDRAKAAEALRKAHFTRLALKSAASRRKAREAREAANQFEAEANAADAELSGGAA